MMRSIILLLVIGLVSGCQHSAQKSYYLLSATGTANHTGEITETIGLGPIELADYLERSHIVRNRDEYRMQLTDIDHWGEPLEKGIGRVLAINLMNKKNGRLVQEFPWRNDATPDYSVRLTIYDLQFINGAATINASWKLMNNKTKTLLTHQHFVRSKTSGNNAADIAANYSALLADLADAMHKAMPEQL